LLKPNKTASLSQQVQEKASEIEFLNRESNALLERANTDETRAAEAERETGELRSRLALLQADLDKSRAEVTRLEALASSSGRNTPQRSWTTTTSGVKMTARQLDEFDKTKKELADLKDRYTDLSDSLGSRVVGLTAEIERLNKDKEQLQGDLVELREKYERALESELITRSILID
jgi:chromosome segregation ATPase